MRDGGVRSLRKKRTRAALIERAQTLTVQHGLSGFTVEELCDQVGVSRRTFFNYFPTKDDAVVGGPDPSLFEAQEVDFLAAGNEGNGALSPTLLTDLARLAIAQLENTGFSRADADRHRAIIHREPQLMVRILQVGESHQRRLAELIARREHLDPADPLPQVIVAVLVGIVHTTFVEFINDANEEPYPTLLGRNLHLAKSLFQQQLDLP